MKMKAFELVKLMRADRNRKLLKVAVYATERCNSRCKICSMWMKKNPQDMSIEIFTKIVDGIDKDTHLCVLGGELLLHPDIDKILTILSERECSYNIETNGILADKLIELTQKYKIPEISLYCDGTGEVYKKIRGVDNYNNVAHLVERLAPITKLNINYVICRWNSREELLKVKELSEKYGASLSVEIYDEFEYLGTPDGMRSNQIYKADDLQAFPRGLLLSLYDKWVNGDLYLPCRAVRWACSINPNGNVYLCTHKMVLLGNLRETSLKKIWNSEKTKKIQAKYRSCNGCWSGCYRNFDVAMFTLKHPKYLIGAIK